jgi:hypothetical protein
MKKRGLNMSEQQRQTGTLTYNGKQYAIDALPQQTKNELLSLQFAEGEIRRLEAQLALARTAANAYRSAVKRGLPEEE